MRSSHVLAMLAILLAAPVARAEVLPFADSQRVGLENGGIDSAVSGDFDADGDDDIVYASRGTGRVAWSRNDRSTFAAPTTLFAQPNVHRLVAADFDLDGRIDLVSATTTGAIAWHRGRPPVAGLAAFDTRPSMAIALTAVTRLAAGDISGDGRADLIVGRDAGTPLHAFLFTGGTGAGFGTDLTVPVPAGAARIDGLGIGDFDGNGFADLAATARSAVGIDPPSVQFFVVPRATATTFGTPFQSEFVTVPPTLGPVAFGDIAVADFDGINGPDAVFAARDEGPGSSAVIMHLNDGTGLGDRDAPGRDALHAGSDHYESLHAADLDRDGDIDLAYNDSSGRAGSWIEMRRGQSSVRHPGGDPAVVQGPRASFAFDADIDGDPDLFTAAANGDVLRSDNRRVHGRTMRLGEVASATITSAQGAPLAGPFEVATRRFGRSAQREALFTEFIGGRVQGLTANSRGLGNLTLAVGTQPLFENVGAASAIAVFDERFDGDDDFVLATGKSTASAAGNQNRLAISVSSSSTPTNTVLGCVQGDDIRGVDIGEFTGTGLRAVYAAEGNNRVALASCPGESLISTVANGAPNGPGVAQLVDFDQDGHLDVLVAARRDEAAPLAGDLIGWYRNLGGATFGALQRIGTVNGADEATLVDFDRDGRIDIATASAGDLATDAQAGRVLLFRNLGAGNFSPPLVAATGIAEPGRIGAADFDHDGDIDLVVPSRSELARGDAGTQCGINYLEASSAGQFLPPICAEPASAARPYTRLAVDDLNGDGIADIVATSERDNVVTVFAPFPPQEYFGNHFIRRSQAAMEDGKELCPFLFRLTADGRADDSDIAISRYDLPIIGADTAGVLEAVVLRRDDGDQIANATRDIEVGRATTVTNGRWSIAVDVPAAALAPGETASFWACLRAAPDVPPTTQEFFVSNPSERVVDAATGIEFSGVVVGIAASRTRVVAAPVFRDGLEGN